MLPAQVPALPVRSSLSETGQKITKQHSHEFVKEEGTAKVRQTIMFTGYLYTSSRLFPSDGILLTSYEFLEARQSNSEPRQYRPLARFTRSFSRRI
jgi:hypothetical protein